MVARIGRNDSNRSLQCSGSDQRLHRRKDDSVVISYSTVASYSTVLYLVLLQSSPVLFKGLGSVPSLPLPLVP